MAARQGKGAKRLAASVGKSPGAPSVDARGEAFFDNLVKQALATGTTGACFVLFQTGETKEGVKTLKNKTGMESISSADFTSGPLRANENPDQPIVLENLGMAIMPASVPPENLRGALMSGADNGIRTIIPERLVWLASSRPWSPLFLRGYQEGVNRLIDDMLVGATPSPAPLAAGFVPSMEEFSSAPWMNFQHVVDRPARPAGAESMGISTWGLRETLVIGSEFTGENVRVAVLDTGLDLDHQDFKDGRVVAVESFVGQPVQDVPTPRDAIRPGNPGHGTHCIGTACGPEVPKGNSVEGRYGVACKAKILVGKVFRNDGLSVDRAILSAINWAIDQKAKVISMSFTGEPMTPDPYAATAERAIAEGVVLIAAVGNESRRPGFMHHVMSPASNIRVMGVGAVDSALRIASFSNRGKFPPGGAVDIVGPGVDVYSSVPLSLGGYGYMQGTSMATPHVAGVAALIAQARPSWGPLDILRSLRESGRVLPGIPDQDQGGGLVQSP